MGNRIEPDLLATAQCEGHSARRRINTIIKHAVAVAACGAIVSACSLKPNIDVSAFKSSPATEQVSVESAPPGADARTATGATCRTPCTLGLPMSDSSITVALNGYTPQTVPVQLDRPTDTRPEEFTQQPHLTPNPVFVELQPAPPVKKPAPKKPKVVARAKPAAEQPVTTTSTLSPAPVGAAMAPPPWPTPQQ